MNEKQKELLENIQLKTIDTMIQGKNLNLLAVMKDCRDKGLFFDEFYEVIFVKMITQFDIKEFANIAAQYENFNIKPLKASQLMNDAIRYSSTEFSSYCNFQNIEFVMTKLHNHNLYLDDFNFNRVQNSVNVHKSKQAFIENNKRIKEYLALDDKLEEKGSLIKQPKI